MQTVEKVDVESRGAMNQAMNTLHDLEEVLAMSGDAGDTLSQLGKKIGAEALLQVLDTMSKPIGVSYQVPSAERFIAAKKREFRNIDICDQVKAGVDLRLMGEKYGLATKYIRQIVEAQQVPVTA